VRSDGASAAIIVASADWGIRATVAVAPWQLVHHAVPQNLLLVYGEADGFVVHETDSTLISRGTRGYLGSNVATNGGRFS
jgi:hypothetical protein